MDHSIFERANQFLGRMMPVFIPGSLIIGIFLGRHVTPFLFLVPWLFAFMTFTGSIGSTFRQLGLVVRHPFPVLLAFIVLHILMPVYAFCVGHLFYHNAPLTVTGFLLSAAIPTGVTSFVWVMMQKGNIPLVLTVILIDTLLSPVVVPLTLMIFAGKSVDINVWSLMSDLFTMIVIPSLLGILFSQRTSVKTQKNAATILSPFSKIGMFVVVLINGGVVTPYLQHLDIQILFILLTVLFISASGYLLSWLSGALFHLKQDMVITLTYSGGMRNISAGSVIAVSFFPAQVVLPVVAGMLFQQVLASFYGQMLAKFYSRPKQQGHAGKETGREPLH
ncbi:bile acid:sodium symporter family protein [Heyndrickxia acidiproducens]|uniref:bile acid:sodium symporter family protein n=1 Tax=Heyndrickxia acidiproducens TaxID=1121084 RepID=UPI00036E47C6|nr:bile acid:sodium symporter family protein [Heyndrickxia acidiproducens]